MSENNQNNKPHKKPSLENLKNLANQNNQAIENTSKEENSKKEHKNQATTENLNSATESQKIVHNNTNIKVKKYGEKLRQIFSHNSSILILLLLIVSLGFNTLNLVLIKNSTQDNITNLNNLSKRLGLTENEIQNLNNPTQSPSEIVQKALKSVVVIEKLIPANTMSGIRSYTQNTLIARPEDKDALSKAAPAKELWEQLGSGVILSKEGEIITNKHIVATNGQYRIKTFEGKSYQVSRVMLHPYEDLAIIKVSDDLRQTTEQEFLPIEFQSKSPQTGDEIYALGHPAKLSFSATKGIVSNPDRNFTQELDGYLENLRLPEILKRAYFSKSGQSQVLPLFLNSDLANTNILQHSAAINLGSSGGAIIDTQGKLLGLNTFGIQRQDTETYNLIPNIENPYGAVESLAETENKVTQGFTPGSDFNSNGAIKADTIAKVWNDYKSASNNKSDYEVADLGFFVNTFTKSQSALWGLPIESGLQISSQTDKIYNYSLPAVNPNGPAKNSGLKEGDIVSNIDNLDLNKENNLGKILSNKKPNDQIKIGYFRLNTQTKTWEKFDTSYSLGGLKAWNEESLKGLKLGDIEL